MASPNLLANELRPSDTVSAHRMGSVGRLAFAAAICAVALESCDGIRLGANVTLGDAFLVGSGLLMITGLARRGLATIVMPGWLLGSGAALTAAALIVERFPPSDVSSFSLQFGQGSIYAAARATAGSNALIPLAAGPSNLTEAARLIGTLVLVPALIASVGTSRYRLMLLADAWVAGATLSSAVALLHAAGVADLGLALTGADYNINVGLGASLREAGLSAQPVLLALSCTTALPVVLAQITAGSWRQRAFASTLAVILALGALSSGSRAGLAGLGLAVVLLPFIQPAARAAALRVALVAGMILLLLVLTGASVLPVITRIISSSTVNSADNAAHLTALSDGLNNFTHSPVFGNGYEYIRGAHDVYVQLLQGGGIISLLGFLLFAGGILRVGYCVGENPRLSTLERLTARALVVSMTVWLALGTFENPVQDRFLYVPAGLILGMNALTRHRRSPVGPPHDSIVRTQQPASASAVGAH